MTETTLVQREQTPSERFTTSAINQYLSDVGRSEISDYERTLIQHIFIRVDMAIADYNVKASNPISWKNINMKKLAIDAVNRVKLGLDALIPGHLYAILYRNGKQEGLFDVDLRIGYKGEEYYTIMGSMFGLKHIYKRLVYAGEKLIVYPKGRNNPVESYELKLTDDPFNKGELLGGFAYLEYEDEELNELVILSKADIEKRHAVARSQDFWGKWYDEMAYKTIIHAAAKKVTLDPTKVNATAIATADAESEVEYPDMAVMQNANVTPIELNADGPVALPEEQPAVEMPPMNSVDPEPTATPVADYAANPNTSQQSMMDIPEAPKLSRKRPF